MKPVWLSEEQRQLRDMLSRLLADGPVPTAQLAELGIMGVTLPEEYGGLGFGLAEATIVAEALGKARSTAPFNENVVIAGGLIDALGSPEQRARWLPKIADGSLTVALAFTEAMHLDPLAPRTLARPSGDGFVLEGRKAPVVHAPAADLILLSARCGNGVSLHAIEGGVLPLSPVYETVDGLAAATIDLAGVRLSADTLLGAPGGARDVLDDVLQKALVVQAAEQTGLMAHLIDTTIVYLKQRQQFGVPLASFQVLQHRVADMLLSYEKAVSLVVKARFRGGERRASVGAAVMGRNGARFVGHEAVQLHGGMGITEELSVGPTLKRIYALETRLGSIDALAARYAEQVHGR